MKKIVIVSGGSGNDALMRGIIEFYPQCELKVIVNAYDDGKSTGLCRRVTGMLGVSDIRKNHYRLYSILNQFNLNQSIVDFYNERFELPKGEELNFVLFKLSHWGMSWMEQYAIKFFDSYKEDDTIKDMNIANIIYSSMYQEMGYEEANKRMCDFLGIDDFVILNSFVNVKLKATTEGEKEIKDEAGIVDFSCANDRIRELVYDSDEPICLNVRALKEIEEADILIISTGTFFSSILPTIEYGDLYKVINKAKGRKYWFINNEEDKDAYGFGSNDFIRIMSEKGVRLEDFTIMENLDGKSNLQERNDNYHIAYYHMGNQKGKHDWRKMVKALFMNYYGIDKDNFDLVLMDFDNTIYSKDNEDVAKDNMIEVSKDARNIIVSGNDYKSAIEPIISNMFGVKMYGFPNKVWADASSVLYMRGERVKVIPSHIIPMEVREKIENYLYETFQIYASSNDDKCTCIKIKPLRELERVLLCKYLNEYAFKVLGLDDVKAIKTGRTTVDIVKAINNKSSVFEFESWGKKKTLYIGDEMEDYGNDVDIANLCTHRIGVENVCETNMILKILNGKRDE